MKFFYIFLIFIFSSISYSEITNIVWSADTFSTTTYTPNERMNFSSSLFSSEDLYSSTNSVIELLDNQAWNLLSFFDNIYNEGVAVLTTDGTLPDGEIEFYGQGYHTYSNGFWTYDGQIYNLTGVQHGEDLNTLRHDTYVFLEHNGDIVQGPIAADLNGIVFYGPGTVKIFKQSFLPNVGVPDASYLTITSSFSGYDRLNYQITSIANDHGKNTAIALNDDGNRLAFAEKINGTNAVIRVYEFDEDSNLWIQVGGFVD